MTRRLSSSKGLPRIGQDAEEVILWQYLVFRDESKYCASTPSVFRHKEAEATWP